MPLQSLVSPLRLCLAVLLCALAGLVPTARAAEAAPDFQAWLGAFRQEALARGIAQATLDAALADVRPLAEVIELDQRQPEFVDTFLNYLDRRITPQRLEEGRKLLRRHARMLARMHKRYGIPPGVLIAFWGLETGYGSDLGRYPVAAALATLSFDHRRSAYFREQLFDALAIVQAGHVAPAAMKGSWAGAMGQMQFMPSTFLAHAVDADGDGRKDLWRSLPDAFASAANYLHDLGWRKAESWGREVRLPEGFDWQLASPDIEKPLEAWAAMGVRRADGKPLPKAEMSGAILLPQGHKGPAFLVYRNFHAMLDWNRSVSYALAVGLLSDGVRGLPGLQNGRDASHERLSKAQAVELQRRLASLGLEPGEADGVIGFRTRAAIRLFQKTVGLPEDGYPSPELLARLQVASAGPSSEQPNTPAPEPKEATGPARSAGTTARDSTI